MELKMIRYGMIAGFAFLLTVTILRWLATREAAGLRAAGMQEADVTAQVWHVLAEARRITEESA